MASAHSFGMTQQHREEGLSKAYVQAVAARAGCTLAKPYPDYGVDYTLQQVVDYNGRRCQSGFALDLALKATVNWDDQNGFIVYDAEAKTYNDLANRTKEKEAVSPLILVLLCLHKEEGSWLEVSHKEMILRHCCYWHIVTGEPTNNRHKIRIHIPKQNQFCPRNVIGLLRKLAKGESLP